MCWPSDASFSMWCSKCNKAKHPNPPCPECGPCLCTALVLKIGLKKDEKKEKKGRRSLLLRFRKCILKPERFHSS